MSKLQPWELAAQKRWQAGIDGGRKHAPSDPFYAGVAREQNGWWKPMVIDRAYTEEDHAKAKAEVVRCIGAAFATAHANRCFVVTFDLCGNVYTRLSESDGGTVKAQLYPSSYGDATWQWRQAESMWARWCEDGVVVAPDGSRLPKDTPCKIIDLRLEPPANRSRPGEVPLAGGDLEPSVHPPLGTPVDSDGQPLMTDSADSFAGICDGFAGVADGEGGIITNGLLSDPSTWTRKGDTVKAFDYGCDIRPYPEAAPADLKAENERLKAENKWLAAELDWVSEYKLFSRRKLEEDNERLAGALEEAHSHGMTLRERLLNEEERPRYRLAFRITLLCALALIGCMVVRDWAMVEPALNHAWAGVSDWLATRDWGAVAAAVGGAALFILAAVSIAKADYTSGWDGGYY